MAINDTILLDGILEDRIFNKIPSSDIGEVFDYLATEQILKDYDLSSDELLSGSVDGRNEGGIDDFFIFVNGHIFNEPKAFPWPKTNGELEIYIITCKHHNTFKLYTVDALVASLEELFDFTLSDEELKGDYNKNLLKKREKFLFVFKRLASILSSFKINIIYASRGDSKEVGENIQSRANHLVSMCSDYFSSCDVRFSFWGSEEILKSYRKLPKYTLELKFQESLSEDGQFVVLVKLKDYYSFITDNGNLRKYLFDSNVRDNMGLNPVNTDIINSLSSNEKTNFWWLNNGITILSTFAQPTGKTITMENIQIVNGLQTSESIFKHFDDKKCDLHNRSVLVKIITTNKPNVRDEIIRATNNQTQVEIASLRATDKIQRDIEEILLKNGLYYERRINFYVNQGVSKTEVINPLYLASAYVNLILKLPHKACVLKNKAIRSDTQYAKIFPDDVDIKIWPALCRILKTVDSSLEILRPAGLGIDNFLKKTRHLTAFLTIARIKKTFSFNKGDIISFDFSLLTHDTISESWAIITDIIGGQWVKNSWSRKEFVSRVCLITAINENIKGYKSYIKRKDILSNYNDLDDEVFIAQVDSLLPLQPWEQGIHQKIAETLNCSPAKVHRAANILIDRGKRYLQNNGVLYTLDLEKVELDKLD